MPLSEHKCQSSPTERWLFLRTVKVLLRREECWCNLEATDQNTFSRKVFCNHHSSLYLDQILLHTEKTERMSISQPDSLPGRTPLPADDNRWELWQGSSSLFPDNRRLLRPHLHPSQNALAREKECLISHLQWGKPKHVRLYVFSSLQKSRSAVANPFSCSEVIQLLLVWTELCALLFSQNTWERFFIETLFLICDRFMNISDSLLLCFLRLLERWSVFLGAGYYTGHCLKS